jgi:hypothetical protein
VKIITRSARGAGICKLCSGERENKEKREVAPEVTMCHARECNKSRIAVQVLATNGVRMRDGAGN